MELCTMVGNSFARQTQFFAGILDVFQENWGGMAEKGPPSGRIDIFQASPKQHSDTFKIFDQISLRQT